MTTITINGITLDPESIQPEPPAKSRRSMLQGFVPPRDPDAAAIAAIATACGSPREELQAGDGKALLQATPEQLEQLSRISGVRHIEPVPKSTLSNDVATKIIAADVVHRKSPFNG